jgi:hypothetical protein
LADLVVFISAFMADDPFVEMRKATHEAPPWAG